MKKIVIFLMVILLVSCQSNNDITIEIENDNQTDTIEEINEVNNVVEVPDEAEHNDSVIEETENVVEINDSINEETDNTVVNEEVDKVVEDDDEVKDDVIEIEVEKRDAYLFKYNERFSLLPYDEAIYSPKVFDKSLTYESIANPEDYTNFSSGQIDMLNSNGFVVLQPKEYPRMNINSAYEAHSYNETPIFISSDILLYMYHEFYSGSMKIYEAMIYYPNLVTITEALAKSSIQAYENAEPSIKEDLKYVAAYYGVAATLLKIEQEYPEEIQRLIDAEVDKIFKADTNETNQILDRMADYSQYTVRGHYVISEEFSDYFRTMMWYGQLGFDLNDENLEKRRNSRARSLMITALLYEEDVSIPIKYSIIYDLTSLYSSTSNDLNIFDMIEIIKSVYGEHPSLALFREDSYDEALDTAIKQSRKAEIVSMDGSSGIEFRFMGQRYSLDADVMQSLIDPIQRPVSTAFDFAGACNPVAEELLRSNYQTNENWPEFDENFEKAKLKIKQFDGWQDDLYHGWLWAIEATLSDDLGNVNKPVFMQNKAWAHKSIVSALSSFTELKHDNVLYSHQVAAECGAGGPKDDFHHYIEPNVELYNRLLWLTENTQQNINRVGELFDFNDPSQYYFSSMIELLTTCKTVSIKELQGDTVTQEEMYELDQIGGVVDFIESGYKAALGRYSTKQIVQSHTSALVADIATVNGVISECAVGLPMDIYVLADVNGVSYLTKGSTYSFYEFTSEKRLTDEQWENMLGVTREYNDGWLSTNYEGPTLNVLEYMPWMSSYVSPDKNEVVIIDKDVRFYD